MIIDTHTHFYDPTRPQGVPWPSPENTRLYRTVMPEHFRTVANPHGVTGTVVVEASPWLEDNQWILDLAANEPGIVAFVGSLAPNRPEFAAELARFAANPLFRGIRCGSARFAAADQAGFLADMARLAQRDLSLDVLCFDRDHLDRVLRVAQELPTLRLVINHILSAPVDGHTPSAALQAAAAQPNVYMKVSGLMENSTVQPAPADLAFYRPMLDALWHAFGEDRLLYGSNWPVCEQAGSYSQCMAIVRAYFEAKGNQAAEKYFAGNARAVYRFP